MVFEIIIIVFSFLPHTYTPLLSASLLNNGAGSKPRCAARWAESTRYKP